MASMTEFTLAQLKEFVKGYVDAAKQAGAWTATTDNIYDLLDKIGDTITIDGGFEDKLPEMSGSDLSLGTTVEEYFVNLVPGKEWSDYETEGANTLAPSMPDVEDVSYSYTLGKRYFKTTVPMNDLKRAALTEGDATQMVSMITKRLADAATMFKYQMKKQILANAYAKAKVATNASTLIETVAIPSNTASAEAFIKKVKSDVETASFANEGHNLGNCLIGSAPELMLYVKKGVLPVVEVDALAGAFNGEKLAIPATVKVVDDFGDLGTNTSDQSVYAILIDPRMCKLRDHYNAVRTQENAQGDYTNVIRHYEGTAFISKYTFVKFYKAQ